MKDMQKILLISKLLKKNGLLQNISIFYGSASKTFCFSTFRLLSCIFLSKECSKNTFDNYYCTRLSII